MSNVVVNGDGLPGPSVVSDQKHIDSSFFSFTPRSLIKTTLSQDSFQIIPIPENRNLNKDE